MNGVLEFVLHHTIKSLTCALEQQYTKCKKYSVTLLVYQKSLRMHRQAEMRVAASYAQ